jgi:hypothetical protein
MKSLHKMANQKGSQILLMIYSKLKEFEKEELKKSILSSFKF